MHKGTIDNASKRESKISTRSLLHGHEYLKK